jgi:hypothetical protein
MKNKKKILNLKGSPHLPLLKNWNLKSYLKNGYFYKDIEKMFSKSCRDNKLRIDHLYGEVTGLRYKKDQTMKMEKDADIFKSKKEQIEIVEQRRQLQKVTRKHKKKHVHRIYYEADSNIRSYKHFKAKKEFESALNDEKKVKEVSEAQKKFKREDNDDTEDEEEVIILEHRPYSLTISRDSTCCQTSQDPPRLLLIMNMYSFFLFLFFF